MVRKTRRKKTLNFKNSEDYRKWLAYNYIHNRRQMGRKPNLNIKIGGRVHKVKHGKKKKA